MMKTKLPTLMISTNCICVVLQCCISSWLVYKLSENGENFQSLFHKAQDDGLKGLLLSWFSSQSKDIQFPIIKV